MAIVNEKIILNDYKLSEDLSRRDIVKVLYNAAKKFLNIKEHPERQIIFKEVALDNNYRCDVLSVSWDEKVTILECKSCRADFELDSKWKNYLDYCDYMFFICPENVINKEDIPKNIGLIWVTGSLLYPLFHVVQSPKKLKPKKLNNGWFRYIFKKLAFRKFINYKDSLIKLDEERFFNN